MILGYFTFCIVLYFTVSGLFAVIFPFCSWNLGGLYWVSDTTNTKWTMNVSKCNLVT